MCSAAVTTVKCSLSPEHFIRHWRSHTQACYKYFHNAICSEIHHYLESLSKHFLRTTKISLLNFILKNKTVPMSSYRSLCPCIRILVSFKFFLGYKQKSVVPGLFHPWIMGQERHHSGIWWHFGWHFFFVATKQSQADGTTSFYLCLSY